MAAAPKKPQDHLPAKTDEVDDNGPIVDFEFDGRTYTGYADNVTGETMEYLSAGHMHRFVSDLVGPEQWNGDKEKKIIGLKTYPIRKLKEVVEVWGAASKAAGNS